MGLSKDAIDKVRKALEETLDGTEGSGVSKIELDRIAQDAVPDERVSHRSVSQILKNMAIEHNGLWYLPEYLPEKAKQAITSTSRGNEQSITLEQPDEFSVKKGGLEISGKVKKVVIFFSLLSGAYLYFNFFS